jgi:hypothetical protein
MFTRGVDFRMFAEHCKYCARGPNGRFVSHCFSIFLLVVLCDFDLRSVYPPIDLLSSITIYSGSRLLGRKFAKNPSLS